MQRVRLLPLLTILVGLLLALGYLGVQRTFARPAIPAGNVITVSTISDDLTVNGNCTLREAIQAANTDSMVDLCPAGDGMDEIVLPTNGVLLGLSGNHEDDNATGDLDITESVTITGHGADLTLINGADLDRIFDIQYGTVTVVITGVHLYNGQATQDNGAAIDNSWGANLSIYNSQISENTATYPTGGAYGGGIYQVGGTITLVNTRVTTNTTNGTGGGIYVSYNNLARLENVVISGNTATGFSSGNGGGGAYFRNATVQLDGVEISHNNATYWGGGMYLRDASVTQTGDLQVAFNHSDSPGGGIYMGEESTLTLNAAQIYSNTATNAGGIDINNGVLYLNGTDIMSNTASGYGGGIDCGMGIAHLSNVRMVNNQANHSGAVDNDCDMTIERTSIVNNVANNTGGGIRNNTTLTLTNSTLSGNSAVWVGGLYAPTGSTSMLTHTSVVSNSASANNGGIDNDGVVQLSNSLLAGNLPNNCAGTAPVSNGYNLDDGTTCSLSDVGDQSNVDAQVGALSLDGGAYVHPLILTSPAVNAAVCLPGFGIDQRGVARPQGAACDIGAYELEIALSPWTYLPLTLK